MIFICEIISLDELIYLVLHCVIASVLILVVIFTYERLQKARVLKPKILSEAQDDFIEKQEMLTEEEKEKLEQQLLDILKEQAPELWADLESKSIKQIVKDIRWVIKNKPRHWKRIALTMKIYLKWIRNFVVEDEFYNS